MMTAVQILAKNRITQRPYALARLVCCLLILLLAAGAFAPEAFAQTPQLAIIVINSEGHSTNITAAQIEKLPHITVDTLDHDKPARFEGAPMSAVLTMAGVQLGDTMRGPRLSEVLLSEAADGYKVAFALAEFDPAFAAREIILADKRDGKLLDAKEGPFRIVAPGDQRPARWIRQVTTLRVIAVK
jgi:hypothetical protein